jgi:hypothetical protein
VTVAPGKAPPLASLTVPVMEPVSNCAHDGVAHNSVKTHMTMSRAVNKVLLQDECDGMTAPTPVGRSPGC